MFQMFIKETITALHYIFAFSICIRGMSLESPCAGCRCRCCSTFGTAGAQLNTCTASVSLNRNWYFVCEYQFSHFNLCTARCKCCCRRRHRCHCRCYILIVFKITSSTKCTISSKSLAHCDRKTIYTNGYVARRILLELLNANRARGQTEQSS